MVVPDPGSQAVDAAGHVPDPASQAFNQGSQALHAPSQTFDIAAPWRLHPSVAVRPERFGALLYHFGTRRLSFLKDRRLLDVLEHLDGERTALEACQAAGVGPAEQSAFSAALARLARIAMLVAGEPR